MRAALKMTARPGLRVAPQRPDLFLALDVGLVVGEHQERIVVQQVVDERPEEIRVAARQARRSR